MNGFRQCTQLEREANERALLRLRKLFPRLSRSMLGDFLINCTAYPFAPLTYCVHKQAAELSKRAHKGIRRAYRIVNDDMDRAMRNMR